jgi:hypothetical protein
MKARHDPEQPNSEKFTCPYPRNLRATLTLWYAPVGPIRDIILEIQSAENKAVSKRLAQVVADGKSFRMLFPTLQAHRRKKFL